MEGDRAEPLDVPADWRVTDAVGINDSGQIALSVSRVQPVQFEVYRYTPGGGYEPLGSFGGSDTEAEAINNVGHVVGFSKGPDGRNYAFRYTDGIGMENLGTNFTRTNWAFAINDLGWVAGYGDGYAFVYRDDLGLIRIGPGRAYGINNAGAVVGVSWHEPWDQGFFYKDGVLKFIGPEPGLRYTPFALLDVNNHDVVVGIGSDENSKWIALMWTETEGLVRLNSLIPPDSGWWLTGANAINDYGQITGHGVLRGEPGAATYRLDPIPPRLRIQ